MSRRAAKRPHEATEASIAPEQLVKLLPRSRKCRGFEYTLGENTDTQALSKHSVCSAGLHAAPFRDIHRWLRIFKSDEAIEMALVDIPDDEPRVEYAHKVKAHRIVLRAPQPVPYVVYLCGIRANSITLDYVPNYFRTDEMLDAALKVRASNLGHMCTDHRTRARCERVLRHGMLESWAHVPTGLRDEAMCLAAIRANSAMLRTIVSTTEISEAVAIAAVREEESVFPHVPQHMRTRAVVEALRRPFDATVFPDIPASMQTPQMRMEAVRRSGAMLQHVTAEHQTPELCAAAVKQNGWAFRHVAPRHRTMALAITAVQRTPSAVALLPEEYLVDALWTADIFHHHHEVFSRLPDAYKTAAMCMSAIRAAYASVLHVPAAYLTRDMCDVAWRGFVREKNEGTRSEYSLSFDCELLLNHHPLLCIAALECDVVNLDVIPDKMRTQEVCLVAMRKDSANWRSVPDACRTEALLLIACEQDPRRYEELKEHEWTEATAKAALSLARKEEEKKDQWRLCGIPRHARTEDVCRLALSNNRGELKDVPERLRTIPMINLAPMSTSTAYAVPPATWTAELVHAFAEAHVTGILSFVPPELHTVELCTSLMSRCSNAVAYHPQPVLRATYLYAISEHHDAICYVPRELLEDEAFCMEVLQVCTNAWNLGEALMNATIWHEDVVVQLALRGQLPWNNLCKNARFTNEMCLTILRGQGLALAHIVNVIEVSHEQCMVAVRQNGMACQYVPWHLRKKEIVEAAIQQNGMALEYVPLDEWTEALCLEAMQRSGMESFDIMVTKGRHFPATSWFFAETYPHRMRRVPLEHITKEMCEMVLERNISNIREVPRRMCTVDMATRYIAAGLRGWWDERLVVQALRRDPALATNIKHWNRALARAAAQASPRAFAHVPDDLRTPSLCALSEQSEATDGQASS